MIRLSIFFLCLPFSLALAAPKPMETFKGCKFIPTDWADGDSFDVQIPGRGKETIRLYGVDCLELHLKGDRNLKRFQEQRRFFGITDVGKNRQESMKIAESYAKDAAVLTAKSLEAPFTVHTRFTPGGGDTDFKRILGFITLADGRDLGGLLVKEGLARSQGDISSLPDGTSANEARGMLQDLEIEALRKGKGIWAKTNWEKLSEERQQLRKEKAEEKIAKKQNAPDPNFKIDPNVATKKELMDLDQIGDKRADRIIAARKKAPLRKPEDLVDLKIVTEKELETFRQHLEFKAP